MKMNKKLIADIKRLLKYLEHDEENHYLACDRKEKKGHIYETIKAIRKAITNPQKPRMYIHLEGGLIQQVDIGTPIDRIPKDIQ